MRKPRYPKVVAVRRLVVNDRNGTRRPGADQNVLGGLVGRAQDLVESAGVRRVECANRAVCAGAGSVGSLIDVARSLRSGAGSPGGSSRPFRSARAWGATRSRRSARARGTARGGCATGAAHATGSNRATRGALPAHVAHATASDRAPPGGGPAALGRPARADRAAAPPGFAAPAGTYAAATSARVAGRAGSSASRGRSPRWRAAIHEDRQHNNGCQSQLRFHHACSLGLPKHIRHLQSERKKTSGRPRLTIRICLHYTNLVRPKMHIWPLPSPPSGTSGPHLPLPTPRAARAPSPSGEYTPSRKMVHRCGLRRKSLLASWMTVTAPV